MQGRTQHRLTSFLVSTSLVFASTISSAAPTQSPAKAAAHAPVRDYSQLSLAELDALRPEWPNPLLSFLPAGAHPDQRYWDAVMAQQAELRRRAAAQPEGQRTIVLAESEPNDASGAANAIAGFGTGPGEDPAADLTGNFAVPAPPTSLGSFAEDDGSIPLASPTGLTFGAAVTISGTIGDGPFGSSGTGSGDVDFFEIPGVLRGQSILLDVDTPIPMGDLDPFIALYDSAGNIVALNEDGDASISYDSFLAVPAPADGDYYLAISGSLFPFAALLGDAFDSSSGPGVGSEGGYDVTIAVEHGDQDWFSFELETCDILGVNLLGAGHHLLLEDSNGTLVMASSQDLSGAFPQTSTLPGGGTAALSFVAPAAGTYRLRALGSDGASYTLELRLFRQSRESTTAGKTLFVDFDGATVDPVIFRSTPGNVTLSPLSSFLSRWGLGSGDESAVVDAVLASLRESIEADPRAMGPNASFGVTILNSRDHPDPFGDPDVSRLIIGGSIGELGIPTIGIAQSIDPGNFDTAETAVVLLDLLSGPSLEPNSLNSFPRSAESTMVALVGTALGNIAAHEAGHFIGNFHTEQTNAAAGLMDAGGNLPNTIGLGPDGTFGTADDEDVDFIPDAFNATERFAGTENTLAVVACGCTGGQVFTDGFESGDASRWSSVQP